LTQVTKLLSDFVAGLRYDDLPAEAVEALKRYVIDYYAACFAGFKVNGDFNRAVEALLLEMGGKPECDSLFLEERLPVMNAAFLNAVYAHGADMDDGNRKAMGHVGCHVISAVLALAQRLGASGKEILTAIDAGYEVYNRLAAAAQPGLVGRGFHSTGTAGAVACGAACARLMGLDGDGIYNSMAIAAVQASGLMLIAESGQACKPLNPANAARTGVLSAMLAGRGVRGPVNPLESQKGWLHAMCDQPALEMITEGLGVTHTVCESYMKPYPSCRHTHGAIDAALKLRERLMGKEIASVRVYIYPNAIRIAGQIHEPATLEDSKFSIHYALAVTLSRGRFGLEDLGLEGLTDEVRRLIAAITLIPDESMERRDEGIRGTRVQVETAKGEVFEETVSIPKGDAANPFTLDELKEKLARCAEGLIDREQQGRLVDNILALEQLERLGSMRLYD